jgi:phosphatidylglycerophosphatase B
MKDEVKKPLIVWLAPLAAICLLMIILAIFPVAFSSLKCGIFISYLWYYISYSADIEGTVIIVSLLGIVLASYAGSLKKKLDIFAINFFVICISLGFLGSLNEYVIKPFAHIARPSHTFLASKGEEVIILKDLYSKKSHERKAYLRAMFQLHKARLVSIPAPVLHTWGKETGYSFPSGHSQNAFLIGTILCYIFFELERKYWLAMLPFAWSIMVCLSRVALGVHTYLDVSAGALQGTILALIFIYSGLYQKLIFSEFHTGFIPRRGVRPTI